MIALPTPIPETVCRARTRTLAIAWSQLRACSRNSWWRRDHGRWERRRYFASWYHCASGAFSR